MANPRSSTTVTPSPIGGRATVTGQAKSTLPRTNITPESVKDSSTLAKVLGDIQDTALGAHDAARTGALSTTSLIKNQTLTIGFQSNIRHSLGRPYVGYFVSRVYTSTRTTPGVAPALVDAATDNIPTGMTPAQYLCIVATGSAIGTKVTCDILVF